MRINKKFWFDIIYRTCFFFSVEILFRMIEKYSLFTWGVIRILLFYIIFNILLELIELKIKNTRVNRIINISLLFIFSLYAWGQIAFHNFLGNYVSVGTSNQIHSVWSYVLEYFHSTEPYYYVLWIPFIICIVSLFIPDDKKIIRNSVINAKDIKYSILVMFGGVLLYVSSIFIPFMQNPLQIVPTSMLLSKATNPSVAVHEFGTSMFFLVDFKNSLFSFREDDYKATLDKYFARREKVGTNEMTGLFKDKNVIVIMMESVNGAIMDRELFPNFSYLLSHSMNFTNNYSPRNSCATADAEFSAITSLYALNRECTMNAYPESDYSESLFNIFRKSGYKVTSYHGYDDTFYPRSVTHIHMGSEAYYDKDALMLDGVDPDWPSDEELMFKASELFTKESPFMAWITTISSHQSYLTDARGTDTLASLLSDRGYSEEVVRYLSKVKILDNGLGTLIKSLREKDILKDTVIVLFGDHYPYALEDESVRMIVDYDIDVFHEIERVPLIIYQDDLEKCDYDYNTSYMNLTPTLANLFDISYDSRLYLGEDIFSPSFSNRLIFADSSWQDSKARFDSSTSEITYFTESPYSAQDIERINYDTFLKKDVSRLAIENNYFRQER